jgi:acetyl esterase/lipase
MPRRIFIRAAAAATFASAVAGAQSPARFDFSIKNIMRGPELYGREPSGIRWTLDGKWIYFSWLEPGSDWRLLPRQYRVRAEPGARPEPVTGPTTDVVFNEPGEPSPDRSMRLMSNANIIAVSDVKSGAVRILTQTLEPKSNVTWGADGRDVYYVANNNAFAISVANSGIRQLTDIRMVDSGGGRGAVAADALGGRGGRGGGGGRGGAGRGGNGSMSADSARALDQRSALARQQQQLFQVLRDAAFRDSVARAAGLGGGRGGRGGRGRGGFDAGGTDVIPGAGEVAARTFRLAPGERVANISVSPSGRAVLFSATIPASRGATPTLVPQWITPTGYVEEMNGRAKVGDTPAGSTRLLFMSLATGRVQPIRLAGNTGPDDRITMQVAGWNETGTHALVRTTSADFKNRWLYTVSADSAKSSLIEALHDSAWVGGPCNNCTGWIDGGKRVYYVSEADGYAHLYTANADGTGRKQLTKGKWEVLDVALSNDRKSFYLTSSQESVFEQHFYRMPVEGGTAVRLTSGVGGHSVTLSPDETMIADVYSIATRPGELYVSKAEPGAQASRLTSSPTAEYLSFPWIKPEIVMIPASDGVQVPARIYRPKDMNAKPNGAAVIFVHGAGYMHNVHNYWSSYSREYLFNQFLASKGYVVLDIDYRASAGYGRDWRTAIYRWMGGRDLQDQVDGAKYLKKNFGIDPERIGMYGGSYGGFMTLMALFTEPKWFGAGAALRSVTDWAHYNHGYTGAILNLPEVDTLAYRRSSPIYFAEGLEDPLVMLHGMVDSNVEFQDIVRLTQRLIELGKRNWYLAPYPVENHGFTRPDSWTDEYTRIFDLFEKTIRVGKKTL